MEGGLCAGKGQVNATGAAPAEESREPETILQSLVLPTTA